MKILTREQERLKDLEQYIPALVFKKTPIYHQMREIDAALGLLDNHKFQIKDG